MMWIRLVGALTVFVTSCIGLGYLAGFGVRRYKWLAWLGGLATFALALLWPIAVVGYFIFDARRYQALHPYDDAPAMVVMSVMMIVAPLLFFLGLPLIFIGSSIARRGGLRGRSDDSPPPNIGMQRTRKSRCFLSSKSCARR